MVLAASGKKTPGITTALTYGCFKTHIKPNGKAQLCVVARRYLHNSIHHSRPAIDVHLPGLSGQTFGVISDFKMSVELLKGGQKPQQILRSNPRGR